MTPMPGVTRKPTSAHPSRTAAIGRPIATCHRTSCRTLSNPEPGDPKEEISPFFIAIFLINILFVSTTPFEFPAHEVITTRLRTTLAAGCLPEGPTGLFLPETCTATIGSIAGPPTSSHQLRGPRGKGGGRGRRTARIAPTADSPEEDPTVHIRMAVAALQWTDRSGCR